MTTPTATRAPRPTPLEQFRTPLAAALLAVLATALSFGLAQVALETAGPVTRADPDILDLRILDAVWYLPLLLGAAAYGSWRWALAGLAGTVAGTVYLADQVVRRYSDSGWGDGLELVIYLVPVATVVDGLLLVALGAFARYRADR